MAAIERGFEGSVTAPSVADVLQLNAGSRFSGSIVVTHRGHEAVIFMQHGEVVHAECGSLRGEEVIGAVMAWPTGSFELHANIATFHRTIDKRLDHLLLDAARAFDEARRNLPQPPAAPPRPAAVERSCEVAGVTYAVVLRGGAPLADASPAAATLAERASRLLSSFAGPLGRAFGLGEVTRAALAIEAEGQLLLLHGKDSYLALAVEEDAPLGEVEAAVRRAVTAGRGA